VSANCSDSNAVRQRNIYNEGLNAVEGPTPDAQTAEALAQRSANSPLFAVAFTECCLSLPHISMHKLSRPIFWQTKLPHPYSYQNHLATHIAHISVLRGRRFAACMGDALWRGRGIGRQKVPSLSTICHSLHPDGTPNTTARAQQLTALDVSDVLLAYYMYYEKCDH